MNEDDRSAHARLRQAFAAACAREGVRAAWRTGDLADGVEFEDQEGAPAALIRQHFGLELVAAGARADEIERLPREPGADEALVSRLATALDTAVRRIRVLLIEHNSYLSGGLPWVFGPADPVLVARGLSTYRYPKLAAVDVSATRASVRIRFAPGDLGAVTSSGFYVPTRIAGDFVATVRYELLEWQPGAATAAVALFAQDEPSLHRYYAQRNSEGTGAHAVLAHLDDLLLPGIPVAAPAGWFRVSRRGPLVQTWHRAAPDREFVLLGEIGGQPLEDLYLGAKIWSRHRSGALSAEFLALEIAGRVSSTQPAPPQTRPDPRDGTATS
jgi:hypothetical protein